MGLTVPRASEAFFLIAQIICIVIRVSYNMCALLSIWGPPLAVIIAVCFPLFFLLLYYDFISSRPASSFLLMEQAKRRVEVSLEVYLCRAETTPAGTSQANQSSIKQHITN